MPALTSIRFFAAFWVVLYHYEREILGLASASVAAWLKPALVMGAAGVSLFFILSGFILAHTYWDRDVTTAGGRREFFLHRFARIYPMYALSLAVVLPRLVLFRDDPAVRYAYSHPWLVGLSHLTMTHEIPFDPVPVLNPPTWSVGCEAGFYLLFPFLFPFFRRVGARGALVAVAVAFALGSVLPILYSQFAFPQWAASLGWGYPPGFDMRLNQAVRMWPLFRLGEFAIGMLLAALVRRIPRWGARGWGALAFVGVLGLGLFALSFRYTELRYSLVIQQVTPVPLFAALILALALTRGERPRFLTAPLLVLLGEASYSLYLIHVPVKNALKLVGERVGLPIGSPAGVALSLLASVGLSILAFRLVEGPARRWIVGRFGARRIAGEPVARSA